MTALDQAFIKAFSRQEVPFGAAMGGSSPAPAVRADLPLDAKGGAPAEIPKPASPAQVSEIFRDVLATLERPGSHSQENSWETRSAQGASLPRGPEAPSRFRETNPVEAVDDALGTHRFANASSAAASAVPFVFDTQLSTLDCGASFVAPDVCSSLILPTCGEAPRGEAPSVLQSPARLDPPAPWTPRVWPEERPSEADSAGTMPASGVATDGPEVCAAENPPETPSSARPGFHPAWQVDRFTWPRVCRRLLARAADEFDRLAESLLAANARGQKTLAIAGCRRGEGATTLLLCAARRLAERGVALALVDADMTRPRLAKRLGVQPQRGWNQIPNENGPALDQALIEAVSNNLTLAPLPAPALHADPAACDWTRLPACLEILKNHFELTLGDLGPLEEVSRLDDSLGRMLAGTLDAVLLVQNRALTSDERLAEIERKLTAAGVVLAGLIENFTTEDD